MGEFMKDHPNLAKNIIPNCAQGKATAIRLWEDLSAKLNAVGPPMKDAKMWRKVYADQKYQAKRKLAFNRGSKSRTGGGPYEEKIITPAEENIIEASGLEASVQGLKTVRTWGTTPKRQSQQEIVSPNEESLEFDAIEYLDEDVTLVESIENDNVPSTSTKKKFSGEEDNNVPSASRRKRQVEDPKLALFKQIVKDSNEAKLNMNVKLDRLVEIQERMLEMKEEKHKRFCALNDVEITLRKRELEAFCDSE